MPRSKTAMKTRAAVALEKGKPLTITEVELEGSL
jgi:Zn-dependent alcohol dehydrogenase